MADFKTFYERYWSTEAPPEHDRLATERRQRLRKCLVDVRPGFTILDYGCGHGDGVDFLTNLGFSAEGVDLADGAITKARSRYPNLSFHTLADWAPATYDACVCFEVIEHVLDPRALLEKFHGLLKPSGYLALSTPYHGIAKNLAIALHGFDRHFDIEGSHIRFFTDQSLVRLLTACQFRVLGIQHFGRVPLLQANTFVWAQRD
jgi:2-polyprenyl-6-hydroxyphenyl methylase/3-demethylubiquinone-9 3-methyltransferase